MTTPSETFWNRLEPSPRMNSIAETLSARIRDPLWMLTRAFQAGEFRGADAGSPAFVTVGGLLSRFAGWRPENQPTQSLDEKRPMERQLESEPLTPDLSLRLELGQTFEVLLDQRGATDTEPVFRAAYPISPIGGPTPDGATAAFVLVCAGRGLDGVDLYRAAKASEPEIPAAVAISPARKDDVKAALANFLDWVDVVFGQIGSTDPPAWRSERLEYGLEMVAVLPSGTRSVLAAHPDRHGMFDWASFDLRPGGRTAGGGEPEVERFDRSTIPAHVRFRGMPNARWWDFESGETDFGGIAADKRDLAKLAVMDFMLVQGNDWFVLPFVQPLGTLCSLTHLIVTDVFGVPTLVERADANPVVGDGQRWTMFSSTVEGRPDELGNFFILAPSASTAVGSGATIEEVHFIRDEIADLSWALESATENGIGEPWSGHDRDDEVKAGSVPPAQPPPKPNQPALKYQIQTTVPVYWIPFLPVSLDPVSGEIALERAAMLSTDPDHHPIEPVGRILMPSSLGEAPYRVREEEVPRSGVRVLRMVHRSRWKDGSTHVWVERIKAAGAGSGASGLRFDLAISAQTPS